MLVKKIDEEKTLSNTKTNMSADIKFFCILFSIPLFCRLYPAMAGKNQSKILRYEYTFI